MSIKAEISIINEKKFPISKSLIEKTVFTTVNSLKKKEIEIEIIIISDIEMRKLNRVWRGIDNTTDVLSFVWKEEKKVKTNFLGQVFISYPQILRQSADFYTPVKKEFCRILIHGILHLYKYDHENEQKAKKMFDLQEKILAKVI